MINYYKRSIKNLNIKSSKEYKEGCIILVSSPEEKELDDLALEFSLERDLLSDALDPYEVPRMELEKNAVYAFARIPTEITGRTATIPLLIIVGNGFLMLVAKKDLDFLFKDLRKRKDFFTTQKTTSFLQIFGEIQADYGQMLTKINKKVNYFSLNMHEIKDNDISNFINFEITLNEFLSALIPIRHTLNNTSHGKILSFSDDDTEMLEDLRLQNEQLIERCKSNLTNSTNLRQAYEVISTSRLNRTMKLLTGMTVILALPTMVTSFYGMNVALPFAQSPFVFWGIVLFIFALVGVLFVAFRGRKLL
ncbi:MAG: magnesium transporter CorA family protein [Patescibacteria group bacterium]|nr:magnesium transporter CorA family protein [Patescibacteria group bacterium]